MTPAGSGEAVSAATTRAVTPSTATAALGILPGSCASPCASALRTGSLPLGR